MVQNLFRPLRVILTIGVESKSAVSNVKRKQIRVLSKFVMILRSGFVATAVTEVTRTLNLVSYTSSAVKVSSKLGSPTKSFSDLKST
jgi:hypothetical protein